MDILATRPTVTALQLSSFKSHRGTQVPLAPLTLLTGASGTGKSGVLQAYTLLSRLCGGAPLRRALETVAGGATACVPDGARPDAQGRRGFRIGCTTDGPAGPVRLDLAVQAEPEVRIVGERLTGGGRVLLSTALTDPGRPRVQAAWHTAGATPVTRAPLPDDQLSTALLPLRVAGRTEGQRQVLAAAEQVLVALRATFPCDPQPEAMRSAATRPPAGPVPAQRSSGTAAPGRLRTVCDNLPDVLERTSRECVRRHAALVSAVRAGCSGPAVEGLRAEVAESADGARTVTRAVLDRVGAAAMPVERLGDGELRYLALALVLLTGPDVLEMDAVAEVLPACQVLSVVADGLDRCLDPRQTYELLDLAARMVARGHIRLLGTVRDASAVEGRPGVGVVRL